METKIVLVSVYQTILSFKRMVSANLLNTLTLFSQTPATTTVLAKCAMFPVAISMEESVFLDPLVVSKQCTLSISSVEETLPFVVIMSNLLT